MDNLTFFAGRLTQICVLNLSHKLITALDQPNADDISHIIIFDSRCRPLSLLNIQCDSCILAQEDQEIRRMFAESLDAGDMPFRGPPPKYEVDMTLPDYHQQDQEQTDTDQQIHRTPGAQERSQPSSTHERSVFRELFDETPGQQPADDNPIPLAERDIDDEILIDTAESDTSDDDLLELSRLEETESTFMARDYSYSSMNETASTGMARDFAYSAVDETRTVAMLNRIYPALIPDQDS